ncbi:hypothetical protein TrVFT333_011725 [Trichoderma virens FT-333]|nr:hypothetical protein TrVFT333_011725 [Trichoderma virens FT-333]
MKYSFVALALAALAQAQTRADIPACALPCLDAAVTANTKCSTSDYVCICKDFDVVQAQATSCVIQKCGTDVAINKVLPATQALCAANSGSGSGSSSAANTTPAKETTSAKETSAAQTSAAQTSAAESSSVASAPPALLPSALLPPRPLLLALLAPALASSPSRWQQDHHRCSHRPYQRQLYHPARPCPGRRSLRLCPVRGLTINDENGDVAMFGGYRISGTTW